MLKLQRKRSLMLHECHLVIDDSTLNCVNHHSKQCFCIFLLHMFCISFSTYANSEFVGFDKYTINE